MSVALPIAWSVEHDMVVRRFGAGLEVLWIHGLGDHSTTFDELAAALTGYAHVLVDLPGYGRTAWPPATMRSSLESHAARLASWVKGRCPIVIGHSMGGVIATLLAERVPVRALIDVEGNLSTGDCKFSAQATAYDLASFVSHGFDDMRRAIHERSITEPALRAYHVGLALAAPHVVHADATDLVALSGTEQLAARLATLARTIPVHYLAGEPDGICVRSRALLDAHAVAWSSIAPSGHWPFLDQREQTLRALRAILGSPRLTRTIPDALRRLYRRIHGHDADQATTTRLDEIAYDDGLLYSDPPWLLDLLSALAGDGPFEDRVLLWEQFFDRSWDVTDFFACVAPVLGIERVHDGETMALSLKALGRSVCFDFESGGGVGLRVT